MILQKVLKPVSSLLIKRRYKNKLNPFEEFNTIKKDLDIPAPTKGAVLIGAIRMSSVSHLFEGLLAYSLRMKGYEVYALFCGQALDHCESKDLSLLANLKCGLCNKEQELFCETFGIKPLYINDQLTSAEKSAISNAVDKITLDKMHNPEGIDLENQITSGLMRILKNSDVKKAAFLPLLKKYALTSMLTFKATDNILNKIDFKQVVMSHGVYSTWGSMMKACELNNSNTVVWGRGYVGKGNVLATHGRSYLIENIVEPVSNFNSLQLSEKQRSKVIDYFQAKRNPNSNVDYISYYKNKTDIQKQLNIRTELSIPAEAKIFGMFPNIPWDGQLFSSSESFKTITEFLTTTVDWFEQNPHAYLIIRAHPAEAHNRAKNQLETFGDIVREKYPKLPKNVIFLDANSAISSYQIEEHIEAALLFAGTIGMEFAINKTLVIQTGKNFNSDKGFVLEPKTFEEYHQMLDGLMSGKIAYTDEMFENILKYGYHWIFKRHIPETTVKLKNELEFDGFKFKAASELNENKVMNWFIDCMLNKKPFIYPLDD
jgi:hypothetical protein